MLEQGSLMLPMAISEPRLQKAGHPCSTLENWAVAFHAVLDQSFPFPSGRHQIQDGSDIFMTVSIVIHYAQQVPRFFNQFGLSRDCSWLRAHSVCIPQGKGLQTLFTDTSDVSTLTGLKIVLSWGALSQVLGMKQPWKTLVGALYLVLCINPVRVF